MPCALGATTLRRASHDYTRYRLVASDMAVLAVVVLFAAINAVLAYIACSQYQFYPTASVLVAWWGVCSYALMMLIPVVLLLRREWWLWRSLR